MKNKKGKMTFFCQLKGLKAYNLTNHTDNKRQYCKHLAKCNKLMYVSILTFGRSQCQLNSKLEL